MTMLLDKLVDQFSLAKKRASVLMRSSVVFWGRTDPHQGPARNRAALTKTGVRSAQEASMLETATGPKVSFKTVNRAFTRLKITHKKNAGRQRAQRDVADGVFERPRALPPTA